MNFMLKHFDTILYGLIGGLSFLFGSIGDGPWKIAVGTILAALVAIKAKRSGNVTPTTKVEIRPE